MPIALAPSGFYEWHDPINPVPAIGVDSARIDQFVASYHENLFRGIFGHKSFGFDQDDMDFLTRTPNAVYLWFWDIALKNIDGIYALTQLASVGINPKRPGIDFARFPGLRTVVNHWLPSDTGISSSAIREYNLWHYKPRSKSFSGLELPSEVERLELNWANPATLCGLPRLDRLKVLQIHRCRNLSDLSELPSIAPNLRALTTTTSRRIDATDGVLDHPSLRSAYVNGKVVLDKTSG